MTKPPEMKLDVLGRIRNTSVPPGRAFIPLVEAVVNSIHATEDRFRGDVPKLGKVEVKIERIPAEATLPGMAGRPRAQGIASFTVTDNGCGFTDENMESFATADSTAKADRGGKGVGRFTWLVVFEEAKIDSTVELGGGKRSRKAFSFLPTTDGIESYSNEVTSDPVSTSVTLIGVKERYAKTLRKGADAIADLLFEQCFNYFVLKRCPAITLIDDGPEAPTIIRVNDLLQEVECDKPVRLDVGSHALNVLHVQRKAFGHKHEAHLCANQRVVESFPLADHSDLGPGPYHNDSGDSVVHQAFVSGNALDDAVDASRTRLDLPYDSPVLEEAGALDLKTLRARLGNHVDERLAEVLQAEREEGFKRVREHIRTAQPEYRHLLTHRPDALERLRWTSDEAKLDERLYRVSQEWDAEVRQHLRVVEDRLTDHDVDPDDFTEELAQVIAEVNEQGQANLVRYVVKRRAVLKLLRRLISVKSGPAYEERVHKVVFPLRTTADEIVFDDHNLWLVDDTLSFYEFIASDKQFCQLEEAPSDSLRRPDLIAFKTGDPYQHVAIVEFKRADRHDENPVQQLVDYSILLRDGGAKDVHGVTMTGVPKSVRIDAYAICTLTPQIEKAIRGGPGNMTPVQEEQRWYGEVPQENLWIEVLDFQAFIRRAEQRNKAFFNKLGLP